MSPRFGNKQPPPTNQSPATGLLLKDPLIGMTGVYLIHFDKKLGHAQHYMGCAEDIAARMKKHKSGHGAKIMQAVKKAGIKWEVVNVWPCKTKWQAEQTEHQKKGYNKRQCPLCTPLIDTRPVARGVAR